MSIFFEKDTVPFYVNVDKLFTENECDEIVNMCMKEKLQNGLVKELETVKSYRDSKVKWISYNTETTGWIFNRLSKCILDVNNKWFKFDISGFSDNLQFTHYKAPQGKYKKHVDKRYNKVIRKLSFSVQLSDSKDYKGGNLVLFDGSKGTVLSKTKGSLFCFPSYTLHEVTKVSKGERNSLVGWITGKNFR